MSFLNLMTLNKELETLEEKESLILACRYIDLVLERLTQENLLLVKKYPVNKSINSPLKPFLDKAAIALALGLISQLEFEEIRNISEMERVFYENTNANFEEPKIVDLTRQLKYSVRRKAISNFELFTSAATALITGLRERNYRNNQRVIKTV